MHPCRGLPPNGVSTAENPSLQADGGSTAPTDAEMHPRKGHRCAGSELPKEKGGGVTIWFEKALRCNRFLAYILKGGVWISKAQNNANVRYREHYLREGTGENP